MHDNTVCIVISGVACFLIMDRKRISPMIEYDITTWGNYDQVEKTEVVL